MCANEVLMQTPIMSNISIFFTNLRYLIKAAEKLKNMYDTCHVLSGLSFETMKGTIVHYM